MGSSIFMFVLGLSAPIAFNSKIQKKGFGYAWIAILIRFFMFIWFNILIKIFYKIDFSAVGMGFESTDLILVFIWLGITTVLVILHFLVLKGTKMQTYALLFWTILSVALWFPIITYEYNVWTIFFGETLAYLAWGTILAGIFLTILKRADQRIWSAIGLLLLHIILWECAKYNQMGPTRWFFELFPGTVLDVIGIPFNIISMGAIAISATCVSDWLLIQYEDPIQGIRKRIIPFTIIIFCFHFLVDFFQPAEHSGINASLASVSIFIAIYLFLAHYAFDKYFNVKIPFLTPLGRNALLMFILQGIYLFIYGIFWSNALEFRAQFPGLVGNFLGICLFIGPIALLIVIAWILDRLKLYLKF